MDTFEDNVEKFGSTTSGEEMRRSLSRCFNILLNSMLDARSTLAGVEKKISDLERGDG